MLAFLSWSSASSCPLNLLKLLLMSSSPCPDILPSIHPPLWSVLSVIKLPDCVRVFVTLKKAKLGVKEVLPVGWYWSLCLGSSFFCPQLDFHSPGGPRKRVRGAWGKEWVWVCSRVPGDVWAIVSILSWCVLSLYKPAVSPGLDAHFSLSSPMAVSYPWSSSHLGMESLEAKGFFPESHSR